jgi:uncharacterized protein YegJ (DUF2314 family)
VNFNFTIPAVVALVALVAVGVFVTRGLARLLGFKVDTAPESKAAENDKKPLISLVLLLREPRYLDCDMVKRIASKVLGHDFTTTDENATDFIVGEHAPFFLKFRGELYLIHCFPKPYMKNPEQASMEIQELRTRKAVSEHKAWMSVDLLQIGEEASDLNSAYQVIGKLVAEFADNDSLAIFAPQTSKINVYDPELDAKLRGPDPLKDFARPVFVPVTAISGDDPRMRAAVEEARKRWPEFVSAFEARSPAGKFAVKAPFTDGTNTEFMWVSVTGIENDVIYGTLDSDPVNVTSVKADQRVKVQLSELNDWMFLKDKKVIGGFTTKVLMSQRRA